MKGDHRGRASGGKSFQGGWGVMLFRALFPPIKPNLLGDERESQDHRYYHGSDRLSD